MIRMKTMTKKQKLTVAALVVLLLAGAGIYQFRAAAPEERGARPTAARTAARGSGLGSSS